MVVPDVIGIYIVLDIIAQFLIVFFRRDISNLFESNSIFNIKRYWFSFVNPWFVYQHSSLNILGCYLLSVSLLCIFPIFGILYWLYFITHYGRKNFYD